MPSSKIQYTSLDPQVLGGVAQEETLDIIKSDINIIDTNASTAATKATSAAKDTTDIKSTLSTVNTNIDTANTNINNILSKLSSSSGNSIIKSIQYGKVSRSGTATTVSIEVTINTVDTTKSIVIMDGGGSYNYSNNGLTVKAVNFMYIDSFESNKITFRSTSRSDSNVSNCVSYQVIEFY